ncbi:MAG: DUF4290 domain-containing protein [Bacteroidetes bacterium]|nr:DUF4290 domain-containing protein [Bacteroidota bacterium]
MSQLFNYNTQSQKLIISEYGRSLQNMVEHALTIEDKYKRTKMAEALISVMETLNPYVKEQADYKQKLWDHLYIISDFQLDVESPFPPPEKNELVKKPEKIPYSTQPIRFRFYGRNLQYMVNKAAQMEESEIKNEFLNLLASFMSNSSRNWNNENLSNNQLADHLELISGKKMNVNPEALEITLEQRRKKFFTPNNNSNSGSNNTNNKKFYNKNKKNNYKK